MMPYILKSRKDALHSESKVDYNSDVENAGELNYMFTCLLIDYWQRKGRYQGINDIIGALEGAKLEFYRRVAAPYEDTKIKENGDVY